MITIENSNKTKDFRLDLKRCYLPIVIRGECPECGMEVVRDLGGDYLSFPPVNSPFDVTLYHEEDEPEYIHHEWEVSMILRVSLEVADV